MLTSQLVGRRFKENPSEATLISHSFLLRGGYIRQVANGIYSLLPPGIKVIRKIEEIVRQEMNRVGGQEVLMPVVLPRELWDESGRYNSVGDELLRFNDRTGHAMLLAMTHEEAVVQLARHEINSYRSYPFMLYQIQTKFRDEPRSRGGLIRVREFTMKDAYSFHVSNSDLQEYYEKCADAYTRIFTRVGLPEVVKVQADTGMMGGKVSHEYMLLVDSGEDTVVTCCKCDYISNREVAVSRRAFLNETEMPLQLVYTPGKQSIADVAAYLNVSENRCAKIVAFEKDVNGIPVIAIIRGDLDINELKIAKIMGCMPEPATEKTMLSTGAVPGYASAMQLSNCRIIVDHSIAESSNLVSGANQVDYHYLNFNVKRDVEQYEVADIALVKDGDVCAQCGGRLVFKRGIEVGNIFQLGSKYTESMNMRYLDHEGKEQIPVMGCYGIGIGRLMASIIEAKHDQYGPVWPLSVAPFTVQIIAVGLSDEQKADFSTLLYNQLVECGVDVIYDDRNERPGVQFADADLIGAPLRLMCGSKQYTSRMIEWKMRDGSGKGMIAFDEVLDFVKEFLSRGLAQL